MLRLIRYNILKWMRTYASKWVVLGIDLLLVCVSYLFAHVTRFSVNYRFDSSTFLTEILVVLGVALFSFLLVGSYKGVIRHTGIRDAFNVFLGLSILLIGLSFFSVINKLLRTYLFFDVSFSILIIHYLFSCFVLIVSRFVFKAFYDIISTEIHQVKNVLIYGAGESGIITYNALNRDKKSNYEIIGFIDDDASKVNKKIDRIKIYDFEKITSDFVTKNEIREVIISTLRIKSSRLLEITEKFEKLKVGVKKVPALSQWIDGDFEVNQIKQLNIEDLLNRDKIVIDNPAVKSKVTDKVILITGAAGSIGSEIVRQLATYKVKNLILLDQAESALYDLQQELHQKGFENFVPIVSDIRDKFKIERIFKKYQPNRIFHAAAYKHVPLMEKSPYEAIKVNVLGTKNVADLAQQYGIERFVMISTDKAVNPTNVMGASKRIAELYISCLSHYSKNTKFTITRFGNVLGSNGSVIPLFKKQLVNGGPLTVTHKEITRYFMTIPEACSLVLEAGTMGQGGEVYIFDMGKSVKIFDLAKRMIYLSGLKYPEDIDIQITGLRPGEKLYEELLADGENTIQTYHEKILIAKTQLLEYDAVKRKIDGLTRVFGDLNNKELVQFMKDIVPEYISNNSTFEELDEVKEVKKV